MDCAIPEHITAVRKQLSAYNDKKHAAKYQINILEIFLENITSQGAWPCAFVNLMCRYFVKLLQFQACHLAKV